MPFISLFQDTALLLVFACGLPSASGQLRDVLKAAEKIDSHSPQELHFDLGSKNELPEGGHLQSVQWFEKGAHDFLILSGSSESFSYFVTVDLSNTPGTTATRSKLLDSPYRHAGGLQVLDGRFAAVGIEDNQAKDKSKVWVIDLAASDFPEHPSPLIEIDRHGAIERSTAGAIAMMRIGNRHLLIVATWDSDTLDFYKSTEHPLNDSKCRFVRTETWSNALADRSDWSDPSFGSYQNINLLTDTSGRIFLVAFCRKGDADLMDLYEIRMGEDTLAPRRLLKRSSKQFHCVKTSFQAGAGVRVLKDGSLTVYACSHRGAVVEWFK